MLNKIVTSVFVCALDNKTQHIMDIFFISPAMKYFFEAQKDESRPSM